MDQEKGSKFEFLHEKVSEVEERMNEINEQNTKKFSIVKENVKIK
jgi:predicted transcriptional regulator